MLNSQTVTITGVMCSGQIRKYANAGISGSSAYDRLNQLFTNIWFQTGGTPSGTYSTIRRYAFSSDEIAVGGTAVDELETMFKYPLWRVIEPLQPLTLRQNEMLVIWNNTGSIGQVEIEVELTIEIIPDGVAETIVAKDYPMNYIKSGKAGELRSKIG